MGLRQHAAQSSAASRPRRRPHHTRDARPRARTGRHRGEGLGAADAHRPCPKPRRQARRLREDARPRRRRLPHRDRRTSGVRVTDRTPRRPSALTSAAIDARDFRRARKDRDTQAHLPDGTLVAITGGKTVSDADAVWTTLDSTRAKYGDMVLLHGGGPGVEKIAASWAEARGVNQVICRPDWNAHGQGRAIPPQRRAAQPAAEGHHRVPRLRHHRQPGRQGEAARHPRVQRRRMTATLPLAPGAGRCFGDDRLPPFRRARCRASPHQPSSIARPARRFRAVARHSRPLTCHPTRHSAPPKCTAAAAPRARSRGSDRRLSLHPLRVRLDTCAPSSDARSSHECNATCHFALSKCIPAVAPRARN